MALNGNSDETNGYNSVAKNGVVANANFIKSMVPPIGTILPWAKTLTNTPALPDGWAECDGSVLSDSDSPYDGVTLPDLNSTQRFLRGSGTSGTTGGADTHTLTVAEMPAHTHTYDKPLLDGDAAHASNSQQVKNRQTGQATGSTGNGDAHNNMPAFYEVVFIIRVK